MAVEINTNWCQSVTGVLIKDNKVLLGRHTYGKGNGKLIVPGGYVKNGESPLDAVKREYEEETGVQIEPVSLIAVRFNARDWYVAFAVNYVSGEPRSDGDENSEVVWVDVEEALSRDDVPLLTKELIRCAKNKSAGLKMADYTADYEKSPYSLFGCAENW